MTLLPSAWLCFALLRGFSCKSVQPCPKVPKQMAEPLAKSPPEENTRSHVKPSICGKRSPMQAISAPVTLPNNASRCAHQCSATTHVHPLALNLARCSRALPCLCNGSRCGATRPVSSNLMHIGRGRCSKFMKAMYELLWLREAAKKMLLFGKKSQMWMGVVLWS